MLITLKNFHNKEKERVILVFPKYFPHKMKPCKCSAKGKYGERKVKEVRRGEEER